MKSAGPALGDVVGGRYRIDRVLGQGGMGRVFAATHLVTGTHVALKMLLPQFADDYKISRRFLREARTAASIRHPNVVVVSDVFDDEHDTPVMVMELLEGASLAEHVRAHGRLALADAIEIFLGVARGLAAAHALGVVHRDLKPENIFLCRDERGRWVGKVLDFGIAKILDPARFQVQSYGSATEHGAMIGTIPYMSYEQAMGHEVDARTDVWSFAVTFVESVSGRRPLTFTSIGEMFITFFQQRVPKATSLIPELDPQLGAALDACLEKEVGERSPDLSGVIAALEGKAPARTRPRLVYGVLGLSLGGLAAALILIAKPKPIVPPKPLAAKLEVVSEPAAVEKIEEPPPPVVAEKVEDASVPKPRRAKPVKPVTATPGIPAPARSRLIDTLYE